MTIADVFKKSGYRTGHFGKWHLGGGRDVDNAPGIKEYGFDEYLSTYESPDAAPELAATNWIWSPHLCIRRGPWKLLMNGDGSSVELYNILEDPFETTDISSEKKMLVRRLSHKLIAWWKNRPIINNSSN